MLDASVVVGDAVVARPRGGVTASTCVSDSSGVVTAGPEAS